MHKFFVEPEQIGEATICLTGENCHHVRHVLRLKKGQEILIKDGQGTDYYCIIEESGDAEIICRIEDIQRSFVELPVSVSLFQGLPKQEKMEWIIQKCVELGVSDIYPVAMKRSVSKIDAKTAAKKQSAGIRLLKAQPSSPVGISYRWYISRFLFGRH